MDVTRALLFSLFLIGSTPSYSVADVEYISPDQQAKIEAKFNEASFDSGKDGETLTKREWICDMYGARSHMQTQHGLKLYTLSNKSGEWHNSGAQLVSEYKAGASALIGRKDRFEDQVKITKEGLLVSRLSLNNAAKTVVAYSVCKTL